MKESKKSIFYSIKLDRKNNSTKSFIILLFYRLMHKSYTLKHPFFLGGVLIRILAIIKEIVFFIIRVDSQISYKAIIGNDIRLLHSGMGVVISAKAIIYDNQTIYHQVTIGINENLPVDAQRVIIHENCYLSVGSKIISSEVGENSKIGPNAVVYKDLPANSLYVSQNLIKK